MFRRFVWLLHGHIADQHCGTVRRTAGTEAVAEAVGEEAIVRNRTTQIRLMLHLTSWQTSAMGQFSANGPTRL